MPAECVRYLPASYIAGDPLLPLVTLRHALSHTSGLPHWTDRGRVPQVYYEPGRCFAYSSPGIDCLQKVVKQRATPGRTTPVWRGSGTRERPWWC